MNLTFNQKVSLGFAIIILLLLASGLSSLYNLWTIDESTTHVNDEAVPILAESNRVQIQLLKLAKLSSLAFNASDKEEILEYRKNFEVGVERFSEMRNSLKAIANQDPDLSGKFTSISDNYEGYLVAVNGMFNAKLELLDAKQRTLDEAGELVALADDVGSALMDVVYYEPPEGKEKDMELVAGYANNADTDMLAVIKTIDEIKRAVEIESLSTAKESFKHAVVNSRIWFDRGREVFADFDEDDLNGAVEESYRVIHERLDISPNIVDHKIEQLTQSDIAKENLVKADKAVSAAVGGLDEMLAAATSQFRTSQAAVFGSLDFGFKSTVGMLVVLILLAAQNFNSMRIAIRKKMIDLAKLNAVGRTLAGAQNQDLALEEVLQCMSDKIGVSQGSVYLTDEANKLKLKACFPPKSIEEGHEAAKFAIGQGVLGKVAETKKVLFVPNTATSKDFVYKEEEESKSLLCVPLLDKDMLVGAINLSGDTNKVVFADSDYEFVSSVASSLVTTIKNIRMREVIEEQNRNLEKKVEERTAALAQKNRDIASMMANMHQGLFTITEGGLIHPEYAAYLETIFDTKRIADRNFADLLFGSCTLSVDVIDQCVTAVDSMVGEDEMMYEFNSHCLMSEMVIKLEDGTEKILELDWDPILDDDTVDKLMVTVRDVTELRALEKEAEGQKQELEIIGQILGVEARKFNEFIETSIDFVAQCRTMIEETQEKDLDVVALLFRNMHTVKGNSRTYGLTHIAGVVHAVESTYDDMRKNEDVPWEQEKLLSELEEADEIIKKYQLVNDEKLGRGETAAEGATIDQEKVAGWINRINEITSEEMSKKAQGMMSEAYELLASVDAKPLSEVVKDVVASVQSLADQLDKEVPDVTIDDGNFLVKSEAHTMLNNIFMHVFRNGIDHGIEKPDERREKGKPEKGAITLDNIPGDGFVTLSVRDDGKGIAISRIYKMAIEKGIYGESDPRPSAAEIANLIFSSGFSTADEVTDVSGRGVGMDAVKGFLEKAGGGIEVVLDEGDEMADFRSFATNIKLPEQYYSIAPNFSQSA